MVTLEIPPGEKKTGGPDVRLIALNSFGSVVRGAFVTGVTMAWRQSSGIQPHAFQSIQYCMDLI